MAERTGKRKLKRRELEQEGLIEELALQNADEMASKRTFERRNIRAKVILQPGSTSELTRLKLQGMTCDLSDGGCRAIFPVGLTVGDIYRLNISLEGMDIPLVFGRCLRCRMVHETAFEAAFAFFEKISLEEWLRGKQPATPEGLL